MKNMGYKDFEIEPYTFTVKEFNDKDIYLMIEKKYAENFHRISKIGTFDEITAVQKKQMEILEKANKSTGEKFWKVQAIQMDGSDTLHNKIIYIDNDNKVVDNYNIK
ncbi:hypothetical protein FK004_17405 [Flavobacterium kingsejongi]|uniref:Uncharacterized protein n=2 Tax=Flavobacterium kingsejongi TaxID=1678728 RepID=A0A2S1LT21_9FLAO|nr:hypothetical protein FK004_17405 [Flavobacterium kingsejongi]